MKNVKIRTIEIYHPENKVSNDFYIEHFKKQGKDVADMLESLGKKYRYIVNDDEDNALTMGIKASLKALNSAGLTGEDIDMILFSSATPEYTFPSQACIVHNAIKGKPEAMVMDTNVNCVGMLVAVDNAVRYLKSNPKFKRALVVGSDFFSAYCKEDDPITYPQFGDLGCALILEKTDEDSGFIDTKYLTNSEKWDMVRFPANGASKLYANGSVRENKIDWTPFEGGLTIEYGTKTIESLLKENDISKEEVSAFLVSQYAIVMKQGYAQSLNVPQDKIPYIGDKYGYTGTTSPFLALYESVKANKVRRGDYIVLWSVGINWTTCAMVFKY